MHKDRYGSVAVSGQGVGQRHEIGAAYKASEQKLRASGRTVFLPMPISSRLCPLCVNKAHFGLRDEGAVFGR